TYALELDGIVGNRRTFIDSHVQDFLDGIGKTCRPKVVEEAGRLLREGLIEVCDEHEKKSGSQGAVAEDLTEVLGGKIRAARRKALVRAKISAALKPTTFLEIEEQVLDDCSPLRAERMK